MGEKRNRDSSSSDDDPAPQTFKKAKPSSDDDPVEKKLKKIREAAQEAARKANIEAARGAGGASPSNLSSSPPCTPPDSIPSATQLQTPLSINSTNVSCDSEGRSIMVLETGSGVSAHFDLDGDYVVRVKRSITSSTNECNVEVTKQLAQRAGMLFLQAEILRDMGEQLLAQYRTSLQHVMGNTVSRIDFTQE